MKKILLLTQFFYPDQTGTGKILMDLFVSLNKYGFTTEVVSSQEMYGDREKRVLAADECVSGIKIHRVFPYFLAKDTVFGRLFTYIGFFLYAATKVIFSRLYREKDLIVSVSNPPIMPLLGAWLKRDGNKFIYIVHDLYPDIAVRMGVVHEKNLMARGMLRVNRYVFRKADKIVVLGTDMRRYLLENYQASVEKICVISNWSQDQKIHNNRGKSNEKFKILYTGNLGKFHNLELAIEVIGNMESAELHFIGEGAQKKSLMEMAANKNNIYFHTFLDAAAYKDELNSADALLVSLEKNLAGIAVPSKFYTYLSVGKPIICIADAETEMAQIIKERKCGVVITHDKDSFYMNLKKLVHSKETCERMGNNAYMLYQEKYTMDHVIRSYVSLFKS